MRPGPYPNRLPNLAHERFPQCGFGLGNIREDTRCQVPGMACIGAKETVLESRTDVRTLTLRAGGPATYVFVRSGAIF